MAASEFLIATRVQYELSQARGRAALETRDTPSTESAPEAAADDGLVHAAEFMLSTRAAREATERAVSASRPTRGRERPR